MPEWIAEIKQAVLHRNVRRLLARTLAVSRSVECTVPQGHSAASIQSRSSSNVLFSIIIRTLPFILQQPDTVSDTLLLSLTDYYNDAEERLQIPDIYIILLMKGIIKRLMRIRCEYELPKTFAPLQWQHTKILFYTLIYSFSSVSTHSRISFAVCLAFLMSIPIAPATARISSIPGFFPFPCTVVACSPPIE